MENSELKNNRFSKRFISIILSSCVFMNGFPVMAQENDSISKSGQVNKLFECITDKALPGASVIVIHHGKVLLKKG
jgi:hypothetical protein